MGPRSTGYVCIPKKESQAVLYNLLFNGYLLFSILLQKNKIIFD